MVATKTSINATPNRYFTNFSLLVGYMTAVLFGYHLTSIEMIGKFFFPVEDELARRHFHYLASIFFILPIISGIFRSLVHFSLKSWFVIIFSCYTVSFIGYVFSFVPLFFISRCLAGFATGLSMTVVPEYIGRIDQARKGLLIYLFQVSIIFGIVVGQFISLFAREMFLVKIFFIVPTSISALFAILSKFIYNPELEPQTVNQQETNRNTLKNLFKNSNAYKSICIAVLIHIAQQATCINGILTYSNSLLEKSTDVPNTAQKRSLIMGIFSFFVTLCTSPLPEKLGRKTLLQISNVLIGISLFMLIQNKFALTAVLIFQFGYSIGLGPITWLLTNEIFPVEYQAVANPALSAINWFCASIMVLFFEMILKKFGPKVLWFNIFWLAIIGISLQVLLKETKNKVAQFQ